MLYTPGFYPEWLYSNVYSISNGIIYIEAFSFYSVPVLQGLWVLLTFFSLNMEKLYKFMQFQPIRNWYASPPWSVFTICQVLLVIEMYAIHYWTSYSFTQHFIFLQKDVLKKNGVTLLKKTNVHTLSRTYCNYSCWVISIVTYCMIACQKL